MKGSDKTLTELAVRVKALPATQNEGHEAGSGEGKKSSAGGGVAAWALADAGEANGAGGAEAPRKEGSFTNDMLVLLSSLQEQTGGSINPGLFAASSPRALPSPSGAADGGRASPAAGAEDPRAIPLYQPQATDPAAERGGSSGSCRPTSTDSRRAAAVFPVADAAPPGGDSAPGGKPGGAALARAVRRMEREQRRGDEELAALAARVGGLDRSVQEVAALVAQLRGQGSDA